MQASSARCCPAYRHSFNRLDHSALGEDCKFDAAAPSLAILNPCAVLGIGLAQKTLRVCVRVASHCLGDDLPASAPLLRFGAGRDDHLQGDSVHNCLHRRCSSRVFVVKGQRRMALDHGMHRVCHLPPHQRSLWLNPAGVWILLRAARIGSPAHTLCQGEALALHAK